MKGRNLTKVDRYLQGKRGVPTTGKFRLVAGNTIRAEARYRKVIIPGSKFIFGLYKGLYKAFIRISLI